MNLLHLWTRFLAKKAKELCSKTLTVNMSAEEVNIFSKSNASRTLKLLLSVIIQALADLRAHSEPSESVKKTVLSSRLAQVSLMPKDTSHLN